MRGNRFARVYFASGFVPDRISPKGFAVTAAIRLFTWSRFSHCCIGYGGAVLDHTREGAVYFAEADMVRCYPTLESIVLVPFSYDIDLDYFQYRVGVPTPLWPSVRHWFLGGEPVHNCLTVTLACLMAGGVPSSNRPLRSPGQLYTWLIEQGYAHVERSTGWEVTARRAITRSMAGQDQPASKCVTQPIIY